ncbi:MAG: hypothetical protein ACI9EF_001021 [Pseudohongiellaceae bacterium]
MIINAASARTLLCLASLVLCGMARGQDAPDPDEEVVDGEAELDDLFDDGLDDLLGGGWAAADEAESDSSEQDFDDFDDFDDLDALLGGGSTDEENDSVLVSWKGFVELRPRGYWADRHQGRDDDQLLLEAEFEFDYRFSEQLSGYFRPRLFTDLRNKDHARTEPYEAYLTWDAESWDLRAGQFVENWGIVDTVNPIDVINRRDLGTDFLDPKRLGELGIRWRTFGEGGDTWGEPTLSLYALPEFRFPNFPDDDGRFSFDGLAGTFFENDGFEPHGHEEIFVASRFNATLETAPFNADVQLLAARGPERSPTIAFVAGPGSAVIPVAYGVNTIGGGFRAVANEDALGHLLASLTFKFEVAHKSPYSFSGSPVATPDAYTTYVLGVDRTFYGITDDQDQLTVTVEYIEETGAHDLTAMLRPLSSDVVLRTFWEANDFDRTSLELRIIEDTQASERIAELIYETQLRSIDEDLKLIFQLQAFDQATAAAGGFGFFPDNSSAAIGLRWEF